MKENITLEVTGAELMDAGVKEMSYLVQPILPKIGLATLAGASDTGKSMFLRYLSICVVGGEDEFVGFKVNATHKSCIYVSTEDGYEATSFLLQRQAKECGADLLNNLRFIFDYDNLIKNLDDCLTGKPADLVIIDCFSDMFDGDLKDTQKIRAFLKPFQKLSEKHQCLILFLHHTGKRTESLAPSKNNLLGGQGFEAKMRLVIEFRIDLTHPDRRHLCIVKGNYLSSEYKGKSYVLNFKKDSFTFTSTGMRVAFDLLAQKPEDEEVRAKYEEAKLLRNQGITYDKIADMIGYSNKGAVTKLFQKGERSGWG